ncbi:hypothetical protein [Bradyrhizobium sp. 930_D9_N1_4]|uniref:hypothetical protein n=1 Tax=Bradyrhizobium sp. 930_D9_N1_4 TaxID=3240374 RepID=UPI003F899167
MTDLELDAYAKLVHALTLTMRLFETSDDLPTVNESNLPPPYIDTGHMSLLERGAGFLWDLEIVRSLDKDNKEFGPFLKFDCRPDDVRAIAIKNAANGPTLDSLVWLYVELRSEFSRMHLDRSTLFFVDEVPSFSICAEEIASFKAMEKLGYVEAVPGGFASTAKTNALLSKPWWDE